MGLSSQPEQSPRAIPIQFPLTLLRGKAWSFSVRSERGLGPWQEHPFSRRFLHWKPRAELSAVPSWVPLSQHTALEGPELLT